MWHTNTSSIVKWWMVDSSLLKLHTSLCHNNNKDLVY